MIQQSMNPNVDPAERHEFLSQGAEPATTCEVCARPVQPMVRFCSETCDTEHREAMADAASY